MSAVRSYSSRATRGKKGAVDWGERRLGEALTDEGGRHVGWSPTIAGSGHEVGVSGELVWPKKRREQWGKMRWARW
jgi:hypothetical protein